MLDSPGEPFWWPEADQALFQGIRDSLRRDIPIFEMQCNINDGDFARACARELLNMIRD
jgi:uncharacterized protein (UPF0261 family)